jgi:hypothetical protein
MSLAQRNDEGWFVRPDGHFFCVPRGNWKVKIIWACLAYLRNDLVAPKAKGGESTTRRYWVLIVKNRQQVREDASLMPSRGAACRL